MIGKIYITDVIGQDTTLIDIVRQVKSQKEATEFVVVIDSVGGYVDEGFAIYDYFKKLHVPVHTFAKKAYSIASVIFMAGERRIVDENANDVLMIHLPWMEIMTAGSYSELVGELEGLKDAEDKLVNFYSKEIGIPSDTIHTLLSKETFLDSKQAVELGFATETKTIAPAMALLTENNKKKEDKSFMNKAEKMLMAIAKSLGIRSELVLQDVNGVEIIFPELEASDEPIVADSATVDGKPAQGEFIMPNGNVLKFEDGSMTEMVVPTDDELPADTNENASEGAENADELPSEDGGADALRTENEELKAKVAELEAKIAELEGSTETQDKLLEILEATTAKMVDIEAKYQALAKSVGSNYEPSAPKNVASATVNADADEKPKFSISRKPLKK